MNSITISPLIREYQPEDLDQIKQLHLDMELDYVMPDLNGPLFLITKVAEIDGKIVMAAATRIEVELYLWVSRKVGTSEEKWEIEQEMNRQMMEELWMKGIDNAVCWVPEEVEKGFAKRLKAMGFSRDRDGWHSWSRRTK